MRPKAVVEFPWISPASTIHYHIDSNHWYDVPVTNRWYETGTSSTGPPPRVTITTVTPSLTKCPLCEGEIPNDRICRLCGGDGVVIVEGDTVRRAKIDNGLTTP